MWLLLSLCLYFQSTLGSGCVSDRRAVVCGCCCHCVSIFSRHWVAVVSVIGGLLCVAVVVIMSLLSVDTG